MSFVEVNECQRGNPLLKYLTAISWRFSPSLADWDYELAGKLGILFVSLQFHQLNPSYFAERVSKTSRKALRVLLCLVDVKDYELFLSEITAACLTHDCTLFLVWSFAEGARYVESLRMSENRSADGLRAIRQPNDPVSTAEKFLLKIRGINKTDVENLLRRFKNIASIAAATRDQLKECPGIGETKIANIIKTFSDPLG